MQITKDQAIIKIKDSSGKIITIHFIKRDGSLRVMNCRLHVKKGVNGKGLNYDPLSKGLLPVFDMNKKGFRMVNLDAILGLSMEGKQYKVRELTEQERVKNSGRF